VVYAIGIGPVAPISEVHALLAELALDVDPIGYFVIKRVF
jgi:hypothetical protein